MADSPVKPSLATYSTRDSIYTSPDGFDADLAKIVPGAKRYPEPIKRSFDVIEDWIDDVTTAGASTLAAAKVVGILPDATIIEVLKKAYPIGCIYTTTVATNPATVLGFGTWVAFSEGKFMLGAGGGYTAGDTGGASTHTLTTAEIPSHTHTYQQATAALHSLAAGGVAINGLTAPSFPETSATGSGGAHNNMPPYIVVYFWNRTA